MSIDADILASVERDIGFASGNISSSMVFGGETIVGTKGSDFESHEIAEEGERIFKEFEWVGKFSDFAAGTLPDQRATVAVDGENVYVMDFDNVEDSMVVFRLRRAT